jgi:transposase
MGNGHTLHIFPPRRSPNILDRNGGGIAGRDFQFEWVPTHGGEPINGGMATSMENAQRQAEQSHKDLTGGWSPEADLFDPRLIGAARLAHRTAADDDNERRLSGGGWSTPEYPRWCSCGAGWEDGGWPRQEWNEDHVTSCKKGLHGHRHNPVGEGWISAQSGEPYRPSGLYSKDPATGKYNLVKPFVGSRTAAEPTGDHLRKQRQGDPDWDRFYENAPAWKAPETDFGLFADQDSVDHYTTTHDTTQNKRPAVREPYDGEFEGEMPYLSDDRSHFLYRDHSLYEQPQWAMLKRHEMNPHQGLYASRTAAYTPNLSGGKQLYSVTNIADLLGSARSSFPRLLRNGEFPSATHTSSSNALLWDDLEPWGKWLDKHNELRKIYPSNGRATVPLPQGWADEFKHNRPPKTVHTTSDIAEMLGVTKSTSRSWFSRQNMRAKPPECTHYIEGTGGKNYFWENPEPMREWYKNYKNGVVPNELGGVSESLAQHDQLQSELPTPIDGKSYLDDGSQARIKNTASRLAGLSDQPDDVTDDYSLAEFFQWCAHNRKDADQHSLAEYAAVSGMDNENYLDIYLFLSDDDGMFRDAAKSDPGKATRLYHFKEVAKELGIPYALLGKRLARGHGPNPTHVVDDHQQLWDNLDVWHKWLQRFREVREQYPTNVPGVQGKLPMPMDWVKEEFQTKPPKSLHSVSSLANELGVKQQSVTSWFNRPNIMSRPPDSSHYTNGRAGHTWRFWESIDPMREWYEKYKKKPNKSTQQGGAPESLGQQDLLHLELPAVIPSFPHGQSVYDSGEQAKVKGPMTVKKIPTCLGCGTQHVGECW